MGKAPLKCMEGSSSAKGGLPGGSDTSWEKGELEMEGKSLPGSEAPLTKTWGVLGE